jgi:hypothetical protein
MARWGSGYPSAPQVLCTSGSSPELGLQFSLFCRLLKKANVPVFASAAKQSSATFPEERSRFRSIRDRFLVCFVALLLAMTAEKTFSAIC